MALVANILTPVRVHSLRHGAAQDIAHLKSDSNKEGGGLATDEIRRVLGHTHTAFLKGATESYAGDYTQEHWNARVSNSTVDPWGPQFSDVSALNHVQKKQRKSK